LPLPGYTLWNTLTGHWSLLRAGACGRMLVTVGAAPSYGKTISESSPRRSALPSSCIGSATWFAIHTPHTYSHPRVTRTRWPFMGVDALPILPRLAALCDIHYVLARITASYVCQKNGTRRLGVSGATCRPARCHLCFLSTERSPLLVCGVIDISDACSTTRAA